VAEYVDGREDREFGDLGRLLGGAVQRHVAAGSFPHVVLMADQRVRATVLGAAEYTVQLSGNTCFLSAPDRLLPRRNLQVLRPELPPGLDGEPDAGAIAEAVRRHLDRFADPRTEVALALSWFGPPTYARLRALATGVRDGLAERTGRGHPAYLLLPADVARTIGTLLREELGLDVDLVVLDGLDLHDYDYVDLGRLRQPSGTVPVTIKSLLFPTDVAATNG
jgi:ethanolamine utilization protein EutA